jgi:hypothetical protein
MSDYTTTYFDDDGIEYTCLWKSGGPRYSDSRGDFGPDEVELIVAHASDGTLITKKNPVWDELVDSWDDAAPIRMEYDKYGNLL